MDRMLVLLRKSQLIWSSRRSHLEDDLEEAPKKIAALQSKQYGNAVRAPILAGRFWGRFAGRGSYQWQRTGAEKDGVEHARPPARGLGPQDSHASDEVIAVGAMKPHF